ncbi:hypothetical protein CR513_11613, partial [Mucuna pruriens]
MKEKNGTLSIDGTSNPKRSGVGIILEGPDRASNNQLEYEALLASMKLTGELEAQFLTAKSNSQLVTSQVNGEYQAKDPQLMKYWDRA